MSEMKIFDDQMKKVIERLQAEYATIRTGRAHVSLVEHVKVEYYGSLVPIQQVCSISIADARTLELKPWDKEALKPIEQALLKSELGITPLNDGKVIRLTMPTPTTERRKEIVKVVKKQSEDFRVAIRNVRREAVESFKKQEKDKMISQDDLKRLEQEIQKLTDHYVKKIDELLAIKEKEVMEV
jgi:ribosome recycling factor